jgi:AraC family transcriptional regulator
MGCLEQNVLNGDTAARGAAMTFGAMAGCQIAVGGLRLSQIGYGERRSCRRHAHEHAFVSFLQHGAFSEAFGKKKLEHRPGDVLFHPEDTVHSDETASGSRFLLLEVSAKLLSVLDLPKSGEPYSCGNAAAGVMKRLEKRMQDRSMDLLELEEAIVELFAPACAISVHPKYAPIMRVREMLHARAGESMTLLQLADESGLHPIYLSRSFRRVFGMRVGQYLSRIRVSLAAVRLTHRDDSLTDIAAQCGFADQSHLTRTFKALRGITPGEYRGSLRNARADAPTIVVRSPKSLCDPRRP